MNNRPNPTDSHRIEVTDDAPASAAAASPNQSDFSPNDGEDPIAGLQADLERFRDLALRSQADFENFKKRAAREKEEGIKYANSALLERLVTIVDNFELGLNAARSEGPDSPVLAGMGMVLKQLNDFLAENGLQPIDAEGQAFDPNLHEAIANQPNESVPEGRVIQQLRRGYKLKDRLLRPSRVIVSSGPAK